MLRYLLLLCLLIRVDFAFASMAEFTAIVVNRSDPDSVTVAEYYQKKRGIPDANIINIEMVSDVNGFNENYFKTIYDKVRAATPSHIQFYVLAWSRPYKVKCMSMTSAFTFGFDEAYCAKGCKATKASPYLNSNSRMPNWDYGIRPTMMLAGSSVEKVIEMIDRGVESDATKPDGTAYLVSTRDKARNVRARMYPLAKQRLSSRLPIEIVRSDALVDKDDVMFYLTGKQWVEDIDSNRFVKGALADHLTSTGGNLFGVNQMSILRWLDAGAVASYGTVVEPCAIPQKFPNPGILIDRYTRGETAIEAYWKSVAWPGQGLFVGEPLAAPYAD